MKQLITLSVENWVFESVLNINRKTKIKVPTASDISAAKNLVDPSLSTIGDTATWWQSFVSRIKMDKIAASIPPANYPAK